MAKCNNKKKAQRRAALKSYRSLAFLIAVLFSDPNTKTPFSLLADIERVGVREHQKKQGTLRKNIQNRMETAGPSSNLLQPCRQLNNNERQGTHAKEERDTIT